MEGMKFKKGNYILANSNIRIYADLIVGIITDVRDDTINAYRIAWINKQSKQWSSSEFIDKYYSKTNRQRALSFYEV